MSAVKIKVVAENDKGDEYITELDYCAISVSISNYGHIKIVTVSNDTIVLFMRDILEIEIYG